MKEARSIIENNAKCAKFLSYLEDNVEREAPYITAAPSIIFDFDGNIIDTNSSGYQKINALSSLTLMTNADKNGKITSSGRSGRKGRHTQYAITSNYDAVSFNKEFYALSVSDAALHMIHEGLHQNKGFSDQALAKAASMYGKKSTAKPKIFEDTPEGKEEASYYLNQMIQRHCGKDMLSTGNETIIR